MPPWTLKGSRAVDEGAVEVVVKEEQGVAVDEGAVEVVAKEEQTVAVMLLRSVAASTEPGHALHAHVSRNFLPR